MTPFLVFTNSEKDYRVTVRSPDAPDSTDAIVDALARACERYLGADFIAIAGVAPIPGETDRYLAFRVFDAGAFSGRPHTLGLVALIVPPRSQRDWSLGSRLAALKPPVPNSPRYVFDNPPQSAETQTLVDPFHQLSSWDDVHMTEGPDTVQFFSVPDGAKPQPEDVKMRVYPSADRGRSLQWSYIVLPLLIVPLAVFILGRGCISPPKQNGDPTTSPNEDMGAAKEAVKQLLIDSGFIDELAVSEPYRWVSVAEVGKLEHLVVRLAEEAGQRLNDLKKQLDDQKELGIDPDTIKGRQAITSLQKKEINNALNAWKRIDGAITLNLPTERPSHRAVERAKIFLGEYSLLRRDMQRVGTLPDDRVEDAITNFEGRLKHALKSHQD
jgi:hypothetical protein